MSSALAVASVTQVLKDVLNNGLNRPDLPGLSQFTVTAIPPDWIETGDDTQTNQLNLFMYMATPNAGWRNQGFPAFNAQGERVSNPPLALDLHYLLSAYGSEELNADILLGYAMQLFHEFPVLARNTIRTLLSPQPVGPLPDRLSYLASSELAQQVEQIKITPESLNTEEISRLWTAFGAKYRPTTFYKATVVLIESRRSTKSALPVRQPNVYVRPFRQPIIEKISSQSREGEPILDNQKILHDYRLVLIGAQLRGEAFTIRVDEIEPPEQNLITLTDNQIIFRLPNELTAGIHGVQIIHEVDMGSPPSPRQGFSSNIEAFVLSPDIESISLADEMLNGVSTRVLALEVAPMVGADQRVVLLLNEISASSPPGMSNAYSIERIADPPSSPPSSTGRVIFPIAQVEAGDYLVRIRIDDAESPINSDFRSPSINII